MKLEHIVALAIRLFALAIAYEAFMAVFDLFIYMRDIDSDFAIVAYVGTVISLLLLSVILWKFPTIIARKIADFPALDEIEINSDVADKLLQTGLIILGVYFLYYVISDLASWGYFLVAIFTSNDNVVLNLERKSAIFATFVELGVSLLLILGSKRVVQLLKKLRYGGS